VEFPFFLTLIVNFEGQINAKTFDPVNLCWLPFVIQVFSSPGSSCAKTSHETSEKLTAMRQSRITDPGYTRNNRSMKSLV